MTVSSTQSYVEYNSDGVTATFTIPFYFLLNSDISAMIADSSGSINEPVNGTDFTVTGAGNSGGGSLTFGTIYNSGNTILIYRSPPVTQETKYYENGKFPAASHEAALDKLTMLIQEYGWRVDSLALKKNSIFATHYDAHTNRISNLGDPINPQDAVTKIYADSVKEDSREYTDQKVADEAEARAAGDAALQAQISGTEPLPASAFSPISWHPQIIPSSVDIPANVNAWSFGPQMTIAAGQRVQVGEGSFWTIADGLQYNETGADIDYGVLS